ncbi:MAG TPA: hypothetical protein VNZ22_19530 [Bacillota bacterium]|nr:hypothetical protein [Bacillota bacterium]
MSNTENPFPSDEEIGFMTSLAGKLQASEFGSLLPDLSTDAEAGLRKSTLAKCLEDAREANQWTLKFCAQALHAKPKQLSALEAGNFEATDAELLGRYLQLLGLKELYGQWMAANPALTAQLGLHAPDKTTPRPADWPAPKPFVLAPDTFRLPPEKRAQAEAQLAALADLGAALGGLTQGLPGGALIEDPRREAAPPAIYQFKITLRHLRPAVWRRVQVPNDLTLGQFHQIIQAVMGWTNDHLHEFRLGGASFGMTHDPMGGPLEMDALDEDAYRLSALGLQAKAKFEYEYDFGDSWEHQIVLEKVLPHQPGFVPVCLKGARACPPEDSGGVWGYTEKLEVLANPKNPEYEELAEWMGADFNPEAFDLAGTNDYLASLARSWKSKRRQRHHQKT